MAALHGSTPLTMTYYKGQLPIPLKNKLLPLLLLNLVFLLPLSAQPDGQYQDDFEKAQKYLDKGNYYKLHKLSKEVLVDYPSDSYFNYIFSYSLYYSQHHKKVKVWYSEEEVWAKILKHLKLSKPLDKLHSTSLTM